MTSQIAKNAPSTSAEYFEATEFRGLQSPTFRLGHSGMQALTTLTTLATGHQSLCARCGAESVEFLTSDPLNHRVTRTQDYVAVPRP